MHRFVSVMSSVLEGETWRPTSSILGKSASVSFVPVVPVKSQQFVLNDVNRTGVVEFVQCAQ